MSQGPSPTPGRPNRPRPPRINIKNLHSNNGSMMGSYPPTAQIPYTAQTANTYGPGGMTAGPGDQPYWPTNGYNPFAAGNFMARGFDGFVDFTKSGMSFGEKFTFGLYNKISKWSKKWFTHLFLLTIMTLYSVGGALIFGAIEGTRAAQDHLDQHSSQKMFIKAMHELARKNDLRKFNNIEWTGELLQTLREHQDAVGSLINNNKTMEELARAKQPWSFWNAMFYCGTIYTTIDYSQSDGSAVRRRRRMGRTVREKTPDPNFKPNVNQPYPIDDEEVEEAETQTVSLQIMPPNTSRSAHQSKILRKRDKNFSTAASRSSSQPRAAERLSSPEAQELLRTSKRSLSSPRHKGDLSESELSTEPYYNRNSAAALEVAEGRSRLEQNLRRFEEERARFEAEKRLFDLERREHKLRRKQLMDNEERRRLLQIYYKQLPKEVDDRRRLAHSFRLPRTDVPTVLRRQPRHSTQDESSTQFSSSEVDEVDNATYFAQNLSPARGNVVVANVRGPPPQPPVAPARRSVSRNNSLSPVRPARRSKTPEQKQDSLQQLERELNETYHTNETPRMPKEDEEHTIRRRKTSLENKPQSEETQIRSEESVKEPVVAVKVTKPKKVTLIKRLIEYIKSWQSKNPKIVISAALEDSPTSTNLFRREWQRLKSDYPQEVKAIRNLRSQCIAHTILLILLCGFGGLMFRYTEGSAENTYKCEVRKVKRDFIDKLWSVSHNMREEDWKTLARQKLRTFEEELHHINELGMRYYYPGQRSWNFVNCIVYCWTVVTTIGYGHITPKTTLGQTLTIIYAIIGIPIFLILLADFGKLFTRGMKFIWAYVRRLYYTGTCRNIRKQQQVQDAIGGFNAVYDMAIRRPSEFFGISQAPDVESTLSEAEKSQAAAAVSHPQTPTSPYPETFEIDDEFNLPVSLASILLIAYILVGTFGYTLWEDWTYFEAFYFVFISMSTIGFGDLVPNHPIFMMCSIIYLIFGLALTSMFINVVQIKLSDTFKDASRKIGATIGLGVASELGDDAMSQAKTPSDLAPVHGPRLDKITEDGEDSTSPPSVDRMLKPTTQKNGHVYE